MQSSVLELLDVKAILAARSGSLDVALVRETLGLLEQALDQRDLLPQLEALLAGCR